MLHEESLSWRIEIGNKRITFFTDGYMNEPAVYYKIAGFVVVVILGVDLFLYVFSFYLSLFMNVFIKGT